MKSRKKQDILQFIVLLTIIISINIIASFIFYRLDLTGEKRFTLSAATKSYLQKLDDVVYVKVYLEGDFPAPFKRLRNSTKEMLDEMRVYAKGNIEYEFVDPSLNPDPRRRNELFKSLNEKGIQPTTVREKGNADVSEKVIFPGALMAYKNQQVAVQLLKGQLGASSDEMISNSIQALEYEITNGIRKLNNSKPKTLGILQGQGELNKFEIADISRELNGWYAVDSVVIAGQLNRLKDFDGLIIARPDSTFSEKDKFIIDQFVMRGGKIVWLLDPMVANMDSLSKTGNMVAFGRDLNLDDMLFKYGVRLNYDLIQDLSAAPIPIVVGHIGNQPQQKLMPWLYYPLIFPNAKHPIVNNLNAVRCEFVSSMDTVGGPALKKTVLLSSSEYSKLQFSPVRVSLNMLREEPDPKQFKKKNIPVSVLVEGQFPSVFANRVPPEIANNQQIGFKESSVPNKMIFVSDGDMVRNHVKAGPRVQILPLGYDRYTGETYGNKKFIFNCVDYLLDDSGLISVRAKEFKIRMLNKAEAQSQKTKWQIINCSIPLLLVIVFGILQSIIRKRKYAA